MATRRDQLHSYQFLLQRVTSALVVQDTDPPTSPFRRLAGSALAGAIITAIVIGGSTVYGLLKSGGKTSWRSETAIVLEKETGARYVYRDGVLHPVANYTSALLLGASEVVSASQASLAGTPRGQTLGILGAPDVVPTVDDLLDGSWSLCGTPSADDLGDATATTTLLVGSTPSDGTALDDEGVLVTADDDPSGSTYLIWDGRRYRVDDPDVVLKALAWTSTTPVLVRAAWLDAIPEGQAIGRITVSRDESDFQEVATGLVFFVRNASGGTQYYVSVADGLARITAMQADILRGDPAMNPTGRSPEEIQAGQVVESSATTLLPESAASPPQTTPELLDGDSGQSSLCAVFATDAGNPTIVVDPTVPEGSSAGDTTGVGPDGRLLADRVVVPPGRGALVMVVTSAEATTGTLMLVTEPGTACAVPEEAVDSLGLSEASPVGLTSALVARLPLGPALDPAEAGQPVSASSS